MLSVFCVPRAFGCPIRRPSLRSSLPLRFACGPLPFMWPWAATGPGWDSRTRLRHPVIAWRSWLRVAWRHAYDCLRHAGPRSGIPLQWLRKILPAFLDVFGGVLKPPPGRKTRLFHPGPRFRWGPGRFEARIRPAPRLRSPLRDEKPGYFIPSPGSDAPKDCLGQI